MRATHAVLKTALDRARKWKLIAANAAEDATAPKTSRSGSACLPAKKRHGCWPRPTGAAARFLSWTRLHRSPGAWLRFAPRRDPRPRLGRVDLDAGTITVRRTVISDEHRRPLLKDGAKTAGSVRTISLAPELIERLRRHKVLTLEQKVAWGGEYWDGPMLCFPAAGGGPMPPQSWRTGCARSSPRPASPAPSRCSLPAYPCVMADGGEDQPESGVEAARPCQRRLHARRLHHPELEEDRAAAATMQELIKGGT